MTPPRTITSNRSTAHTSRADCVRPGAQGCKLRQMTATISRIRRTAIFVLTCASAFGQNDPNRKDWIQAFNGKNLDGWIMKITGYPLGENFGNTFRVDDGLLKVSYDQYPEFANKFGHIFYRTKFSHYIVAAEYRFVGEQAKGGPSWAFRNNGIMLHCQAPETMGKDQDFPISVEAQLLGAGPTGERSTLNVCTPGTEVFRNGE